MSAPMNFAPQYRVSYRWTGLPWSERQFSDPAEVREFLRDLCEGGELEGVIVYDKDGWPIITFRGQSSFKLGLTLAGKGNC